MTQRFALIIVSLFLFTVAFAQTDKEETTLDYYSSITRMLVLYGDMKYDSALQVFNQAQTFKERVTAIDYYYGAACAALTHQPAMAMNHLRECVKKGWLDTLRLLDDNAFDSLRTTRQWKPLMAEIRMNYKKLLELFKGLKGKNPLDLVPYTDGDNWGWAEKKTGAALTAASFEYTAFADNNGLAFSYKDGAYRFADNKFTMQPIDVPYDEGGQPEERTDKAFAEFAAVNNNRYTIVKAEKGVNIKKEATGALVFKHDYEAIDHIREVNGGVFFMVSANGIRFYVDEKGKEYIKRPS